ncbi:MAG: hypothetical protein J1E85_06255 [Ruminococcus sp.]|nr:hypothetical protein [Ruminococcus sp.]
MRISNIISKIKNKFFRTHKPYIMIDEFYTKMPITKPNLTDEDKKHLLSTHYGAINPKVTTVTQSSDMFDKSDAFCRCITNNDVVFGTLGEGKSVDLKVQKYR